MHKLFSIVVSFSVLSFCGVALANDENVIPPTNDNWGCAGLIQQGGANPPVPANDLATIKVCINHCDAMYRTLGDQGRVVDMMRGSNYCRKSLNNLYFSSVAQTITDELNQQTQQQQASQQQAFYEQISSLIKQQQQNQADTSSNSNKGTALNNTQTTTPPAHSFPIGPPDNVNW